MRTFQMGLGGRDSFPGVPNLIGQCKAKRIVIGTRAVGGNQNTFAGFGVIQDRG